MKYLSSSVVREEGIFSLYKGLYPAVLRHIGMVVLMSCDSHECHNNECSVFWLPNDIL